jgi:cytochrome P450
MMVHPHIQKKVQAELDAVIGHSRIPNATDRPRLPYADAAWRESVRWHPTLVVAVPHNTTSDDIYKGMYIPNNSMILLNLGSVRVFPFSSCSPYSLRIFTQMYASGSTNL